MNRLEYPRIGETVYHTVLENGLNIFVTPKPEHTKSYAFFAANYGGMDMRFTLNGQSYDTPAGVAHYLEHKMFDTEQGNALQDLAANGASPNAFTSSALTGYFFESTGKFEENLRILLSFVSVPYFTKESVDKEQGIIAQEIRMYDDSPDWQVYLNMVSGLYSVHPIREGVAGTVESISRITAQTLYDCHRAFYDPSNMVLCVAGPVDPERVCAVAREVLPAPSGLEVRRCYGGEEPEGAARSLVTVRMDVPVPLFQAAFKGEVGAAAGDSQRTQLVGELAAEVLCGTSSELYARLYGRGLINGEFSCACEVYPGCAFLCAGGESRDPERVAAAIQEEAVRLVREGIDPALWQRLKKSLYGGRVRALNSFENLCVGRAQSFFMGSDPLDFPAVFDRVTTRDVRDLLARWVTPERSTLSVVRSGTKEGDV